MPKVDDKHFSYDKAGIAAAKKEAKETGKKMTTSNYSEGGKIKLRGVGAATKGIYARGPMA